MVHRETFEVSSKGFCEVHDVTKQVQKAIKTSGVFEGIIVIEVIGQTAGVTTLEYEPHLKKDLNDLLERITPSDKTYHHNDAWGDDNGFSHLRAALVGPSVALSIHEGKLEAGTWQQPVVIDFDNRPRTREVIIRIVGE
jgi:secondary thiamine-phosphate synthase enzyme